MNLKIEQTRNILVNDINNSNLPVGVAILLLKDLIQELQFSYNQILASEYNKQQYEDDVEEIQIEEEKEQDE